MGRLAKARGPAAAVAVYCVLAVLAYWPVSPLSSTQIMNCGCRDAAQEAWFLAWAPFALGHLHSLFFSDWIGYPHGVDLAANTSMPLLGVLTAPITALWGPVADYNFLLRLSFAISATSCFFVLRREVDWQPAAFVGGLLYGFSPYVVGEGLGHVFLAFVPIPPLLFAVTYGIVRGHSAKPWRAGLLLGVLGALQFFISPEILVTTGLLLAVGLVAAAAVRPGAALLRLRSSLEAFGSTAAFLVISLAYPVWEFARGPQHIDGPSHSVAGLAPYHADLLSAIVPSQSEKIAPFGLAAVGNRLTGFNVTETGAYVGIPLLMLLGALAWRCRDDLRVRLAAFLGVVSFVLSMGPRLEVDGADTHVPLPFALLQHVPIVQGASAGRFSLYTALFIAVVLVVGIDDWRKTVAARIDPRRAKAVVAGVTVSCLLPLLPAFP
ncbi:MAG TPA: hypothetical protein VGS21_12180, partial [Acidimicrobiales bacterium]|nr:hypothetical protein [Acidimicrobiales bacterium]